MKTEINRLAYLFHLAGSATVSFIATGVMAEGDETAAAIALVCLIAAITWQVWAMLARLNHLNMTKWAILLFIVPLANIWIGFYLLLGRGYADKHAAMNTGVTA